MSSPSLRLLIDTCQKCSTSPTNHEPRSPANGVFKIQGFVRKRFLPSPPLPPPFFFWLSPHFPRRKNTENPVPRSFFAPKPYGNACYAGYCETRKWNTQFHRKIANGKTGLPFQKFHFFREFSSGTNRKIMFHLQPNRNFRNLLVNGKHPMCPGYDCYYYHYSY